MTDRPTPATLPATAAGRELDRYLTHYATALGTDQEHHLDLRVHDRLILAIEAEAQQQVVEQMLAQARQWKVDGMFTEAEWGAVMAVLNVERIGLHDEGSPDAD